MVRKSQMPCKSGWPSAVRGTVQVSAAPATWVAGDVVWPARGAGASDATAITRGRTGTEDVRRRRLMPPSCSLVRLLTQMAVHQLFHKLHAFEFQELSVLLQPPIERHADLPRPRKHLRVLDGGLIVEGIGGQGCVALDHVQGVAVKIAGSVKPGPVVQAGYVDHERIPLE